MRRKYHKRRNVYQKWRVRVKEAMKGQSITVRTPKHITKYGIERKWKQRKQNSSSLWLTQIKENQLPIIKFWNFKSTLKTYHTWDQRKEENCIWNNHNNHWKPSQAPKSKFSQQKTWKLKMFSSNLHTSEFFQKVSILEMKIFMI